MRSNSQPLFPKSTRQPTKSVSVRKTPAIPKIKPLVKRKLDEPVTPEKQISKKLSSSPAASSAKKLPSYIPKPIPKNVAKTMDPSTRKVLSSDKTIIPLAQSISTLPKISNQSSPVERKVEPTKKEGAPQNTKADESVIELIKSTIEALDKTREKLNEYVSLNKACESLDQCAKIFAIMKKKNAKGKSISGEVMQFNSLISAVEENMPKKPQLDVRIAEAVKSVADLNHVLQFANFEDASAIEYVGKRLQKLGTESALAAAGPIGFIDISDHYQALQESYDEMKKEMEQEKAKRIENEQKEEIRLKYLNRLHNNHKKVEALKSKCNNEAFEKIFKRQKVIISKLEDIN
jgi:hypothetical protein